jgi:hypothetical protein
MAHSRGTLVVSRRLREHALSKGAQAAWVIPCVLSSTTRLARCDSGRQEWRRRLRIDDATTALVYCGGFSEWQCVSDAISLFRQTLPYFANGAKLVLITPSPHKAADMAQGGGVPDPIALTLPPGEVQSALSACDIGIMLREATRTNQCAFPNKFAEYVAAGLYVLSSGGVTDPAALIRDHRLGDLVTPEEVRAGLGPARLMALISGFRHSGGRDARLMRISPLLRCELNMEERVTNFIRDLDR